MLLQNTNGPSESYGNDDIEDVDTKTALMYYNTSRVVALRARNTEQRQKIAEFVESQRDVRTTAQKIYDAILPLLGPEHEPSSIRFQCDTGDVCVTDMVRMCTGKSRPAANSMIYDTVRDDPRPMHSFKIRPDGSSSGHKHTALFCEHRFAADICAVALQKNRLVSSYCKTKILRAMGVHTTVLFPIAEVDTVTSIATTFEAYDPVRQYQVIGCHNDLYRIDLYLRKSKIAIECDEHGHSSYNKTEEATRQHAIEARLGCHFVRYNPHEDGFAVEAVHAKILKAMAPHSKKRSLPMDDAPSTKKRKLVAQLKIAQLEFDLIQMEEDASK